LQSLSELPIKTPVIVLERIINRFYFEYICSIKDTSLFCHIKEPRVERMVRGNPCF